MPHLWYHKSLDQCIRCGVFWPKRRICCDPKRIAGRTEPCCECGEDYPLSDLIAGHIFCAKCRKGEEERAN